MNTFKLPVCRTVSALRQEIAHQKTTLGQRVGMVPTMGALHEGHLSLISQAKEQNDVVILTIFVNPLQFGEGEDLESYPRRLAEDVSLGESVGATLVFSPDPEDFYDPNHQTTVTNSGLENLYCGQFRPGHFNGVLTVVAKLLMAGLPDTAYFGQKDYQQLFLIKRMVADLNIPVKVLGCSTIRESSGLAKSSRNEYLSAEELQKASQIYQVLQEAKKGLVNGLNWSDIHLKGIEVLVNSGFDEVQYFEYLSQDTLMPISDNSTPGVLIIAALIGNTRLIDNLEISS